MSSLSFFQSLLAGAEKALIAIGPSVGPALHAAESAIPIVEALVPKATPTIEAIKAGAASISAVAPTAVQDAQDIIAHGKKTYADIGPAIHALESVFAGLFHVTPTPQGIVLTPKTTAATSGT